MKRALTAVVALTMVAAGCSDGAAESVVPSEPVTTPNTALADVVPATDLTTTAPVEREYDISEAAAIIDAFVAEHGLNGAGLVLIDGQAGIVGEYYNGVYSPDRVTLLASATKLVTAGVVMHLVDQGLLALDQPIAEYVPWAAGHNEQITMAHLLSNSSGLVELFPARYQPYICQFLGSDLQACAAEIWTSPDDDAEVVAPDSEFRYGGGQWQVAGAVAETVSGKSWAQLIDEIYVEPCGLDSFGYNNHWLPLRTGATGYPAGWTGDPAILPPTDNPHIEGGAYSDPIDYAKILLVHLQGGRCGDTDVLSDESLAAMHADRIGPAYGGESRPGYGYGLGFWIDRSGSGRITDPGAYGAVPWLDLDGGFGAFLVLESDSVLGDELAEQLYEPVEAAILAGRA